MNPKVCDELLSNISPTLVYEQRPRRLCVKEVEFCYVLKILKTSILNIL